MPFHEESVQMRKSSQFLKAVYEAKNLIQRKKALNSGSSEDLLCLMQVIKHCLEGHIPLRSKEDWKSIIQSGKGSLMNHFQNEIEFNKLLKLSRRKQILFLSKISYFKQLLHACFNLQ